MNNLNRYRKYSPKRRSITTLVTILMTVALGLSLATPSLASSSADNRATARTSGPVIPAQPADASGCTNANLVIELCIFVKGGNNLVEYVDAQKNYSAGYVNACDSVSMLVNGQVYLSSGRFCSPAGTYLSHKFDVYVNFSDGTQICTRWDSYPNYLPCKTVY